jgi:hypothetical protein
VRHLPWTHISSLDHLDTYHFDSASLPEPLIKFDIIQHRYELLNESLRYSAGSISSSSMVFGSSFLPGSSMKHTRL